MPGPVDVTVHSAKVRHSCGHDRYIATTGRLNLLLEMLQKQPCPICLLKVLSQDCWEMWSKIDSVIGVVLDSRWQWVKMGPRDSFEKGADREIAEARRRRRDALAIIYKIRSGETAEYPCWASQGKELRIACAAAMFESGAWTTDFFMQDRHWTFVATFIRNYQRQKKEMIRHESPTEEHIDNSDKEYGGAIDYEGDIADGGPGL